MFNCTRNDFEVLSGGKNGYAPRLQANDLAKAVVPVNKKDEMAVEVCDRLAAVSEALRYVTYRYHEPVNSALANDALYT